MDLERAIKASKNGAIAAFLSGGITILFALYATGSDTQGTFKFMNDPTIVVDIALVFVCAFGMLRNSRTAAVTIFIYFLISKIYMALEFGQMIGLAAGVIFLYFYGKAIQGSFVYYKIKKSEVPE